MSLEVGGAVIELSKNGYLANIDDWNEQVATALAEQDGITLTQRHWDVMNYLRDLYINHNGEQPNMRKMLKGLEDIWGEKLDTKDVYALFPLGPAKQAPKIAGLPETKTKGGY
ncbi:Sulfurtransferase TusE [Gammaproteobacteria bacterium]